MIYADYAATTPVHPLVVEEMEPYWRECFGNPSGLHYIARCARSALEKSRDKIASLMNCCPEEIYFTSGGTEGDNLAVVGLARAARNQKNRTHIIVSQVEHPAVIRTCQALENHGFKVSYLPVLEDGRVSLEELKAMVCEDTALVSVMAANNETGAVMPSQEIGEFLDNKGICYHIDAIQAIGKVAFDWRACKACAVSASAHKFYGPKGIGFNIMAKAVPFEPLFAGGGQEWGARPGTQNTPAIVGMTKALELILGQREEEEERLRSLTLHLRKEISGGVRDCIAVAGHEGCLPHVTTFAFSGVRGECLVLELERRGVAASSGSSCSSAKGGGSRVLDAMGLSSEYSQGALRLSLGRETDLAQVEDIVKAVKEAVQHIRETSPRMPVEA